MLNEVRLLAVPVTCCCLGLQKRNELSYPLRVDGDHAGLQYLKKAKDIFVKWKASGSAGFTNEIFTACMHTNYECSFKACKTLTGKIRIFICTIIKFMSDPIEGRFGWYW